MYKKATGGSLLKLRHHQRCPSGHVSLREAQGEPRPPEAATEPLPSHVCHPSVDVQGLAYVEFAEETHASQAVLKMDGMVIDGNKVSVAISNPPRRNMDKPGSGRPLDPIPRQVYGL